ncbi:MAG TPA: energy transducer TonB, partial [Alcanivorax sp.]|nr:energy transducer TonB [Alcanivorax sp.]
PFTQDMRERMDVLEIIRTWKFDANRRVSSK